MKNLIIAANWKSNKSKPEAKKWLDEYATAQITSEHKIILFAPFTLLDFVASYIKDNNLNLSLGAQDVSVFEKGAYTGEINADQIKEFANYVLIGHSERRANFNESVETINNKINQAISADLTPIVCFSNLDQLENINKQNLIIAYEPLDAIGTGSPDNPENTKTIASKVKEELRESRVIYGGSINAENIKNYTSIDKIEGVLVGGESLDSASFLNITKNAD